jgi:hypothetical protein
MTPRRGLPPTHSAWGGRIRYARGCWKDGARRVRGQESTEACIGEPRGNGIGACIGACIGDPRGNGIGACMGACIGDLGLHFGNQNRPNRTNNESKFKAIFKSEKGSPRSSWGRLGPILGHFGDHLGASNSAPVVEIVVREQESRFSC